MLSFAFSVEIWGMILKQTHTSDLLSSICIMVISRVQTF